MYCEKSESDFSSYELLVNNICFKKTDTLYIGTTYRKVASSRPVYYSIQNFQGLIYMGLHGWDSTHMFTVVSSKKGFGPKLMHTTVCTPTPWLTRIRFTQISIT